MKNSVAHVPSFREQLDYTPVPLKFGTSGRRGLVQDLTQVEVYLNALAELEYLQSLPTMEGGITRGEEFYFASDLRPSSCAVLSGNPARGGIAQAIEQAIRDAGMRPVFLGTIPTPALAYHGFSSGKGSMMVTGSHIPFDRNGYKTNSARGELLKRDELPIEQRVEVLRRRLYAQPAAASMFETRGPFAGMFRNQNRPLPEANHTAAGDYLRRYTEFFGPASLAGFRLLVYEHSAVGRDLLAEVLQRLGATVIIAGRSPDFVPIDTEAVDIGLLRNIQALAEIAWREHGPLDAVVSTDGDSDRPLMLGLRTSADAASTCHCEAQFFGGDLLGILVAEYLRADAVVVPISCNDAVDRGTLQQIVQPKTRIGSPYVIAGMQKAIAAGCKAVCGWEANGGFLLGSDLARDNRRLRALPTRDAFLPILSLLHSAKAQGLKVCDLFDRLPKRFSRAALLKNFSRTMSMRLLSRFTPAIEGVENIRCAKDLEIRDASGNVIASEASTRAAVAVICDALQGCFKSEWGFGQIVGLNYTDGIRIYFSNGDVAHVRPSGNADELRIYAVANTQQRADAIAEMGIAEPDGILRCLERCTNQEKSLSS